MSFLTSPRFLAIFLLVISNILMTFAWYGHLKFKAVPLYLVILISWSIAGIEYCFLVPANRIGNQVFSVTELKIIQEFLTIVVFSIFAMTYMHEKIHWNHLVAFLCIIAAVFFTFLPKTD